MFTSCFHERGRVVFHGWSTAAPVGGPSARLCFLLGQTDNIRVPRLSLLRICVFEDVHSARVWLARLFHRIRLVLSVDAGVD